MRPELAPVEGTVRLAGEALEGAIVIFKPAEGRASRGVTDAKGRYELTYLRDVKGAKLGSHRVTVSTRSELSPMELVPTRYNKQSELTAEITDRHNVIDFDLKR